MKTHPMAQEFLHILMQALGLIPMEPVRVRTEDRLDAAAYPPPDADTLD